MVRTALNTGISRWRRRRREVAVADPGIMADPPVVHQAPGSVDPVAVGVDVAVTALTPASVTFKHLNPSCAIYPGGAPGSPSQPPALC